MMRKATRKIQRLISAQFVNIAKTRHNHVPKNADIITLNLITSWGEECGIASYSAFLANELKKRISVYLTVLRKKNALSPYFPVLGSISGRSKDIVHVQFEYGLFSSLKLGRRSLTAFAALPFYLGLLFGNRPVVTTVHEPRKKIIASGRSSSLYTKFLDTLIFAASDLIIVHTQESRKLLIRLYGVSETKLKVIPHGSFEQPVLLDKDECKRKLNLQGKTVLTILGFVTPKKGHDLLIPLLPKIEANVQLVIAGGPQVPDDVAYLEKLKGLAEQFHCSDRILFTGFLPDLSVVINVTDIAVLPYRTVTESGVLHLLISSKLPIITSDLEAFKEIYQEFGCLELFKNGDQQDLLSKIELLLSSPD